MLAGESIDAQEDEERPRASASDMESKKPDTEKTLGPALSDTALMKVHGQLAELNEQAPPVISDLDFDSALSADDDE